MTRAYLRLDPAVFERKAIQQTYSPSEFAAFVGVLCLAESQPERGRFRDERLLRALLGKLGRSVPALIERGDLVGMDDGRLYVDGWDEWQEGDVTVRDRMARLRSRKRNADRNIKRHPPSRYAPPSSSEELLGGTGHSDSPIPPPSGGSPRANGTNPRAIARALTLKAEEAAKARKARRQARYLAYGRGEITEAQRIEMDEADAPLSDIVGKAS